MTKSEIKVDHSLIGAAGEHLVLSRLLARGFLAAQAPRGVRKADILVNFLDGGAPFLIQVKARSQRGGRGWAMNEKHESIVEPDLFYCFVDFTQEHPSVHVVPAQVVADEVAQHHAHWLATPGLQGQPHNDTPMRRLQQHSPVRGANWMAEYLEHWDPLEARRDRSLAPQQVSN